MAEDRMSARKYERVQVESLARNHTKSAIKILAAIMTAEDQPGATRVLAAKILLERGWGKAVEHFHIAETPKLSKIIHEYVHISEPLEQEDEPLQVEYHETTNGSGNGQGTQ